jgi:hypothetical protein
MEMPYRWRKQMDVDETVCVIQNSLNNDPELPHWLIETIKGAIADSDTQYTQYFFEEVKKYTPQAMKYFELAK